MATKRKKSARQPGYFCVTTGPAKKMQTRCMLKKVGKGGTKFVKSGNIKCPKRCRKTR